MQKDKAQHACSTIGANHAGQSQLWEVMVAVADGYGCVGCHSLIWLGAVARVYTLALKCEGMAAAPAYTDRSWGDSGRTW